MLNASPEYELASKGGANGEDAVTPVTRTLLYREYNSIVDTPDVTVSPVAIEDRFGADNVLNSRNPDYRGISFGPLDEFYFSEDPTYGYRFIPNGRYEEEREYAYFIPQNTGGSALATVTIDYGALHDMNSVQVRYDHTRDESTTYDYDIELYVGPTTGSLTQVYNGATNDDGNTQVFYNGTNWAAGPSRVNGSTVSARYVRVVFSKNSDNVNPRVMYLGGLEVVALDEDIVNLEVNKSEYEQSTYLPYGESTSNTMSISLDNTAGLYRYGPNADENYFQKYQRITTEIGFDTTKYGGSGTEFVPAGTYWIEEFDYDEPTMTASATATDFSMFLKERMCENKVWVNRSLKYIIKDTLARSGFSPKFTIFNFGITGNANEANKKAYVWSHDEQTVWDFLTTLIKSELGTIYFNEEGRMVVTDREYFRTSIDNGSVDTLTASVDFAGLSETNVIDANKVSVKYSDINAASTKFNPSAVATNAGIEYVNLGERYKTDIVWSPADDTFLGSAGLIRGLKPDSTHILCPASDALQISEDEGIVRIGRELIKYSDRQVTTNYLKLKIEERGAFGTPVNDTVSSYRYKPPLAVRRFRRGDTTNVNPNVDTSVMTRRGLRMKQLYRSQYGWGKWKNYIIRPGSLNNTSSAYDVYGMSFTFNKISSRYKSDQAAGMFLNLRDGYSFYFEVNERALRTGGTNLVAYKGAPNMTHSVPMPPFAASHTSEQIILFEESGTDDTGQFKVGTPIEIMVFNDKDQKRLSWFVNGNVVASTNYHYSRYTTGIMDGLTGQQGNTLNFGASRGYFGAFLHGSTDITLDYIFATNRDQFDGYDVLRPYSRGKNTFERRWLPEEFVGYYEEFGGVVHEAMEIEAGHNTFPNLNPMVLNTLDDKVHIHYQSHNAFDSKMVISNNDRYGVNINGTNFSADGTQLTSGFMVYAVPIITEEEDQIEVKDKVAIRRYGPSEIEINNEWVDSVGLAKSLGKSVTAQWARPVTFFDIDWFPNPALQPGDRFQVSYTEKGFELTDIWIVTGVSISYDGGLSGTIRAKRFTTAPPVPIGGGSRGIA